jgi:hypothetical protein
VTGGFIEQMWAPTLHQLAEVLGIEVEQLEVVSETDGLDHDVETGFGIVKAGTGASAPVAARRAMSPTARMESSRSDGASEPPAPPPRGRRRVRHGERDLGSSGFCRRGRRSVK